VHELNIYSQFCLSILSLEVKNDKIRAEIVKRYKVWDFINSSNEKLSFLMEQVLNS
jgi:hypothetical protein